MLYGILHGRSLFHQVWVDAEWGASFLLTALRLQPTYLVLLASTVGT